MKYKVTFMFVLSVTGISQAYNLDRSSRTPYIREPIGTLLNDRDIKTLSGFTSPVLPEVKNNLSSHEEAFPWKLAEVIDVKEKDFSEKVSSSQNLTIIPNRRKESVMGACILGFVFGLFCVFYGVAMFVLKDSLDHVLCNNSYVKYVLIAFYPLLYILGYCVFFAIEILKWLFRRIVSLLNIVMPSKTVKPEPEPVLQTGNKAISPVDEVRLLSEGVKDEGKIC